MIHIAGFTSQVISFCNSDIGRFYINVPLASFRYVYNREIQIMCVITIMTIFSLLSKFKYMFELFFLIVVAEAAHVCIPGFEIVACYSQVMQCFAKLHCECVAYLCCLQ